MGFADDDDEDSDEDDLARAIRESQKQEVHGNDDDEAELLSRALRESQQQEDERKRLEQQEEQELEIALRESQQVYALFHATGDDDFQRTLQQSLWEAHLTMDDEGEAISDSKWKAIMSAYDDVDDDMDEDDEEEDKNNGRSASSGSGGPAAASSTPARASGSGSGGGSSAAASSSQGAPDSAAASSGGQGHGAGRSFDLQGWFRRRADELKVDFEKDVLWFVLNELEEQQLDDREVVKMSLGLSPDDKVPASLSSLIGEFAQQKRGMNRSHCK
eukprot:TRINITY_DN10572_c0_g1_i1.p1 TRINITY_DN10572_c0_g1~~TRINITY_DN10572_c0_g1_i1.p1  ORF type:complete len:274 (+),score=103.15 TRINITY_DN10572_c0_g1_i1:146-967(+)